MPDLLFEARSTATPSPSPAFPAAAATQIAEAKGVAYFDLPCRSVLNRCTSPRMPFEWTINPYRGCEFACTYCYARYTHEFMGFDDPLDFERKIFVKRDAPRTLLRDLTSSRLEGRSIAIGTATDPYQPAERTYKVTRGILETLARCRGLRLSLTTKSALVVRDLDLLGAIAARSRLTINVSVTTLDRRLARRLEPRATTPEKRFEAIETLRAAGIAAGVFLMPVLPGITDSESSLEAVIARSARAGALYLASQVLFLTSSSRLRFFAFLRQDLPDRYRAYRDIYGASMEHRESYRRRIHDLVDRLRRRYGLVSSMREDGEERPNVAAAPGGPALAGAGGAGGEQMPLVL